MKNSPYDMADSVADLGVLFFRPQLSAISDRTFWSNAHIKHVVGESKHGSNDFFESFLTGFAEDSSAERECSEVRCEEYFGNFYTRLKRKKNDKIAIVATASKMLVSIFYMLRRNEPFDPPEVSA